MARQWRELLGGFPPNSRRTKEKGAHGGATPAPERTKAWRLGWLAAPMLAIALSVVAGCGVEIPDLAVEAATSSDGPTTWSGPGYVSINDVVETPFGLVAVGSDVWISTNGRTWERQFLPTMQSNWGSWVMNDVDWDGTKLVAVGQSRSKNDLWGTASVWWSNDGKSWLPAPNNGSFTGNDATTMYSLAIGESGRMVAVGEEADFATSSENPRIRGVAWVSEEGVLWDRVELPSAESGYGKVIRVRSVESTRNGFTAIGTNVWTTRNGTDWNVAASDEGGFPGADAIAVGSGAYSALGNPAWRSGNGEDWWYVETSDTPDGLRAAGGNDEVVVAFSSATLDESAQFLPHRSSDALSWETGSGDAFATGDVVYGVSRNGDGWVAVGRSGGGGRVWTSTDGLTWNVVTTGNRPVEPPTETVTEVTTLPLPGNGLEGEVPAEAPADVLDDTGIADVEPDTGVVDDLDLEGTEPE